jgi:hypothetical protein
MIAEAMPSPCQTGVLCVLKNLLQVLPTGFTSSSCSFAKLMPREHAIQHLPTRRI